MTKKIESGNSMPHPKNQFQTLNIIQPILKAVQEEGYITPTPIQEQAIPIILQGADLLGCAQTGTGKTAAFAIPILQLLYADRTYSRKRRIRSLVVTPTRELAIQIGESFDAYGRHTGLKNTVVFGGVSQNQQTTALLHGVDILVATPGRLLDLMNQGFITLRDVEFFVLDEADRMLDMGFIHDVKKLIAALPGQRQSLFFSATMPPEIIKLAGTILHNPANVSVTPESMTVDIIRQSVYFVDKDNKCALLANILKDVNVKTALVFTRTKHGADKVAKFLLKNSIKAEAIHGNKSQNARQRALTNFKAQTTRILVATDIAARGIDVDELEYVINFDMPNIAETYVHRIGRTGRAGAKGTALSFCNSEEKAYLRDIEQLIVKKITIVEDHPFPLMNTNSAKAPEQQLIKRNSGHSRPKPTVLPMDKQPVKPQEQPQSNRNSGRAKPKLPLSSFDNTRVKQQEQQQEKRNSNYSKPKLTLSSFENTPVKKQEQQQGKKNSNRSWNKYSRNSK